MSDTFEKMMAKFNQPVERTKVATNLQVILRELNKSLLNLKEICKSPTQYLNSVNELNSILPESSPSYMQCKHLQTILKADIKSIDMFIKTAISRNKTITEMIEFGSADENEMMAISRLAMVCLKVNLTQAEACLEVNMSSLRLLRIIQNSI